MNQTVAKILWEIGEYLAMQEVPFKPRAYAKAADSVANLEEDIGDIYRRDGLKGLRGIPGVGEAIALKVEEYLKTGKLRYYEELKRAAPVDLTELSRVSGLGPKNIRTLYEKLGVKTLDDLEKAAKAGRIAELPRFGKKIQANIRQGIAFARTGGKRAILGFELPKIEAIAERLRRLPATAKIVIAGSARRRRETIGDADLLVVSRTPGEVMTAFVNQPEVVRILAHGETKSAVLLRSGLQVDLRVVPANSYGAALNYFTGSKDHNVALRQIALRQGLKLNEYGLFQGEREIAGATEEDLYRALGLVYIPPELRENTGEIEAALRERQGQKPGLPDLVGYGDLRGDLQVQTDWSDGSASIEAMALAAEKRGLEYIAITDHSRRLAMTNGLTPERLRKQRAEIERVNRKLAGRIRVLSGTECDILKDGSLDLPDGILAKLDVVGVSVHSYFQLTRKDQTERLVRAIRNPNSDILFHPTGRVINRRQPYDFDPDPVIAAAAQAGAVLEIDAYPDRSDLSDENIRRCVERGVKLAVDSDAHHPEHFVYLEHGLALARRGWAARRDVVNAWPLERMQTYLKPHASQPPQTVPREPRRTHRQRQRR